MEQVENRVSGIEDEVDKLEQSDKDKEKMLIKYEQNRQDIWDTIKRPNLEIMGVEERRETC
jgi:hypothetical protein